MKEKMIRILNDFENQLMKAARQGRRAYVWTQHDELKCYKKEQKNQHYNNNIEIIDTLLSDITDRKYANIQVGLGLIILALLEDCDMEKIGQQDDLLKKLLSAFNNNMIRYLINNSNIYTMDKMNIVKLINKMKVYVKNHSLKEKMIKILEEVKPGLITQTKITYGEVDLGDTILTKLLDVIAQSNGDIKNSLMIAIGKLHDLNKKTPSVKNLGVLLQLFSERNVDNLHGDLPKEFTFFLRRAETQLNLLDFFETNDRHDIAEEIKKSELSYFPGSYFMIDVCESLFERLENSGIKGKRILQIAIIKIISINPDYTRGMPYDNLKNIFTSDDLVSLKTSNDLNAKEVNSLNHIQMLYSPGAQLIEQNVNRVLFRGDDRAPNEIFENGFSRQDKSKLRSIEQEINLPEFAAGYKFIPCTTRPEVAARFPLPHIDVINNDLRYENISYIYIVFVGKAYTTGTAGYLRNVISRKAYRMGDEFDLFVDTNELSVASDIPSEKIVGAIKIKRYFDNKTGSADTKFVEGNFEIKDFIRNEKCNLLDQHIDVGYIVESVGGYINDHENEKIDYYGHDFLGDQSKVTEQKSDLFHTKPFKSQDHEHKKLLEMLAAYHESLSKTYDSSPQQYKTHISKKLKVVTEVYKDVCDGGDLQAACEKFSKNCRDSLATKILKFITMTVDTAATAEQSLEKEFKSRF